MNEKNTEELFRLLLNAAYLAALPDSQKQKLWEDAKKENPDAPLVSYFDNIMDKGMPISRGVFEKIKQNLF